MVDRVDFDLMAKIDVNENKFPECRVPPFSILLHAMRVNIRDGLYAAVRKLV